MQMLLAGVSSKYESGNWEEVISHLIVGTKKAVLPHEKLREYISEGGFGKKRSIF
jgi:hypothetical protein